MLILLFLMAWTIAAGAYTLVFRDGRRIEVPAKFLLTSSTLTYEVAPGFSKTVQLILIDVSATERANQETAGAFLKHADQDVSAIAPAVTASARITLTNRELEPTKRRRLESERDYERRRIELGLPSIEETRRQREQEQDELLAQARTRALEQANDEAYWRERARELRSQIVATDSEINYLRSRLGEFRQFPLTTNSLVTSVLPLVPLATYSAVVPPLSNSGAFASAPRFGQLATQRGLFFGSPFRGPNVARPFAGFGSFANGYGAPFLPARPFDYVEDAYGRANLTERLDDLLVLRAGLTARWLQLEDEARDARVPQVWLEP
jgi:hypothetical protein